ncbi:hypothetical protein GCM10012283_30560 [Phycicoccus endophyticus]|nr:hypothetical protein GCM10012283_30560 [Phycicoccus endophyticus]
MEFLTIPEELAGAAVAAVEDLAKAGYSVKIEDSSLIGVPYLPTISATRGQTTVHVFVETSIPSTSKLREFRAYCAAQRTDTRYALTLPSSANPSSESLAQVQRHGIGLYLCGAEGMHELSPPADLTLNLNLPDLSRYPNRVRRELGPSWETCRRGQALEGFDDACVVLEGLARKYIIRHRSKRSLTFLRASGARTVSDATIRRMTMGQLAVLFGEIHNPNHADTQLTNVLKALNPDRVRVAHRRRDGRSLGALRQNIHGHFWSIAEGVEAALK